MSTVMIWLLLFQTKTEDGKPSPATNGSMLMCTAHCARLSLKAA